MGAPSDIGAYEYGSPALLMTTLQADDQVSILVYGVQQRICWLLASPDLNVWHSIATNQIGLNGAATFRDPVIGAQQRFYRVVLP